MEFIKLKWSLNTNRAVHVHSWMGNILPISTNLSDKAQARPWQSKTFSNTPTYFHHPKASSVHQTCSNYLTTMNLNATNCSNTLRELTHESQRQTQTSNIMAMKMDDSENRADARHSLRKKEHHRTQTDTKTLNSSALHSATVVEF